MKTAENVIDSNQDINEEAEDNKFAENETFQKTRTEDIQQEVVEL